MSKKIEDIKKLITSTDLGIVTMGFILLKSGNYTKDELIKDWKLWKVITSKKYMYLCYKYRPDLLDNFKTVYLEGYLNDSEYFFNYEKVVHLTIKGGHIPKIDERFAVFKNLSTLQIIECGVEEITYDFSKNTKLKMLSLNANLIKDLPEKFLRNKDMFTVDLTSNVIEKIPDFLNYEKNGFSCSTVYLTNNPFKYDNPIKMRVRTLMHPKNYDKHYLYYEGQWPHLNVQ